MLSAQFKEVSKIDTRIRRIHKELADLYEQRTILAEAGELLLMSTAQDGSPAQSAQREYARLVNTWHRYGVKAPTYKYLKPSLDKAQKVMQDLVLAKPELKGNLSVVLVPPTKDLQKAIEGRANVQSFVDGVDSIDYEIASPEPSQRWRVVVAYGAKEGLAWDSARHILDQKSYMIGGHDTRALGIEEYAALTLHRTDGIDADSWTMLVRDVEGQQVLPCATFQDGRYRFAYDDLDNIFGDDRFRPAVEV